MRIGVLLPTNVYFSPYSRVYTDLLDELGVDYDIIYFDKRNLNELAAHRFSASLSSTDLWRFFCTFTLEFKASGNVQEK